MIQMQATEAKTHFLKLLTQVENGETISITRHGQEVAYITPIPAKKRLQKEELMARFQALRDSIVPVPLEEILAARHDGHPY